MKYQSPDFGKKAAVQEPDVFLHKGGELNFILGKAFCFERKMRLTEIHTASGDRLVGKKDMIDASWIDMTVLLLNFPDNAVEDSIRAGTVRRIG